MAAALRCSVLRGSEVAEAPTQVYMGDLPVLVGMRDIDADEPMCRIFILLLARTSLLGRSFQCQGAFARACSLSFTHKPISRGHAMSLFLYSNPVMSPGHVRPTVPPPTTGKH